MGRNDKGNVGFIGIGTMGREMVRNLLMAGHAVRVFDLDEAALADSAREGAARAKSPADAAQGAQCRCATSKLGCACTGCARAD